MNNLEKNLSVLAPVSGKIIAIEQVPDPVFSGKTLGDGVAIIPEDGKIYSPVNGTVTTVSSTLHASVWVWPWVSRSQARVWVKQASSWV